MKKTLLLVAFATLALTSCGGTTNSSSTTTEETTTSAPTSSESSIDNESTSTSQNEEKEVILNFAKENATSPITLESFMSEYVTSDLVESVDLAGVDIVVTDPQNPNKSVIKLGTKQTAGSLQLNVKAGLTIKSAEVVASHYFKSYLSGENVGWSADKGETFNINEKEYTLPEFVENAPQTQGVFKITDESVLGSTSLKIESGTSGYRINLYSIKLTLN